jgi:hypothetical protein
MSNFTGASLRDIETTITNANADERDALTAEAIAILQTRADRATERKQVGKAKRTLKFIAQLTEGKPDHKAAFASAKPKAKRKPKAKQAPVGSNVAGMSDADLAGMVAMLTSELAKRNA